MNDFSYVAVALEEGYFNDIIAVFDDEAAVDAFLAEQDNLSPLPEEEIPYGHPTHDRNFIIDEDVRYKLVIMRTKKQ